MLKNTINHLLEKKQNQLLQNIQKIYINYQRLKNQKSTFKLPFVKKKKKSEKLLRKKKMHKSNKIRACF